MKIVIEEIKNIEEIEVIIRCSSQDESVRKIEKTLRQIDNHILAKNNDRTFILSPSDVYYFESVDNKVFAYTQKELYETSYKLYELESLLDPSIFLRVNKNTVLNISKIGFFKSSLNGRMEATLKNNEAIIITRTYVNTIKRMLGGTSL
ncbi:MAG: LytTR family DNA-binding domain-containing protein [Candidatus Izemoplasmatales bacterium]|jgi:DNA-binding LytR/AlgR family response regulator|nr:LytTR family DNA-binding domain-containing protein [Candidatus Izemoplasmatales bacterium]